jgi:hypothetical protein
VSDCPRMMTKDQIIAGLRAGRVLNIDRRDAPEHKDVAELISAGFATAELVELDEQSSVIKIRWTGKELPQ